ncbi:MAG: HNH endonuclease [Patescibacteria group bacterium]|jgi:hypothetical protein
MAALPKYKIILPLAFIALAVVLFYLALHGSTITKGQRLAALLSSSDNQRVVFDLPQKTSQCQAHDGLPDHDCTPGAIFSNASKDEICVQGYSASVRNVSTLTKEAIYQAYGLAYPQTFGAYEADHLIPLELGGSNDVANLFPEAADPKPGYHEKDLVENFLHQEVCAGRVGLGAAQRQIARDWLAVYRNLSTQQLRMLKQQYRSWSE